MNDANELRAELGQHYSSQQVFHHNLVRSFVYTEGARAFFKNAGKGAYWLSDILATEPAIRKGVIEHDLCVAVLNVKGSKAELVVARDMREQDGVRTFESLVFERAFDYTDCPEGVWQLLLSFTTVGDHNVIMALLPSEN
jgi:alkylation response protein AidB-like acyl-CoA dehydrogenase